jgi:hypothetical protein
LDDRGVHAIPGITWLECRWNAGPGHCPERDLNYNVLDRFGTFQRVAPDFTRKIFMRGALPRYGHWADAPTPEGRGQNTGDGMVLIPIIEFDNNTHFENLKAFVADRGQLRQARQSTTGFWPPSIESVAPVT